MRILVTGVSGQVEARWYIVFSPGGVLAADRQPLICRSHPDRGRA
jgi:hypothetical protein